MKTKQERGIILPTKIETRLKEEAKKLEISEDELVVKALSEFFREPLDPESRVDVHLALADKCLREAEKFAKDKDYVQASEKAWGAASQMLKAVAAKRGVELRSHGELHKFAAKLREETEDEEIRRLWQVASSLHQNLYESWLPDRTVEESIRDTRKFVEKLRKVIG